MDILQALKHWLGTDVERVADFGAAPITNARAERIQHQIAEMERLAVDTVRVAENAIEKQIDDLRSRIDGLSRRNENVDAFYVKTVAKAIDERFIGIQKANMAAITEGHKANHIRTEELIKQIDSLVAELRQERARIDTLTKQHATLLARLRGIGEAN
jgi:hypothetical protein